MRMCPSIPLAIARSTQDTSTSINQEYKVPALSE